VLFPQDKEGYGSIASHEENGFVFSRSQRSSAPNNHRNSESELYSAVANCTMLAMEIHVDSIGKAKRLLKKTM